MAFDIQDKSYSGTYAGAFIMQSTYAMDTIDKGLVNVVGDIKKQYTIPRINYDNPLKPRAAVPVADDQNAFTLDGRLLLPRSFDAYEEVNPRDFEENQLAEALSTTILDRSIPSSIEAQMMQLLLDRAGEKVEDGIWMASLQYFGKVAKDDPRYQLQYFNGFMQRFVNDPLVNVSSISPVAISTSNIANIFIDLIAQATKKKKSLITDKNSFDKMKFIIGPTTAAIYLAYLGVYTQFKGNSLTSGFMPPFQGYKVERAAGVPGDTIIFCRSTDTADSNLWVGMNSMEDWTVKMGKTAAANETFFLQAKWKMDVNYGWSQEIFMYTTLTKNDFIV